MVKVQVFLWGGVARWNAVFVSWIGRRIRKSLVKIARRRAKLDRDDILVEQPAGDEARKDNGYIIIALKIDASFYF